MNESQRALLADKLGDAANLVAGALIVAQSVGGSPYSIPLAVTGLVLWLVLTGGCAVAGGSMNDNATLLTVLTIYGGIAVFAFIVALLDSIARKRNANRPASTPAHRPNPPISS